MRANIRSLSSIDGVDLDDWVPTSEGWAFGLRVLAGPDDGPGEESFDLTVCNLHWLTEQIRLYGTFDGRHHLIVEKFDRPALKAYVGRRVEQCDGATWDEVAAKLARLGHWEFEEYRP